MKIGSHVSNSGDKMFLGAVEETISYKANVFMVYLGAPQNTYRREYEDFRFNEALVLMANNNLDIFDYVVHAPYIVNPATHDKEKAKFAVEFLTKEIILANDLLCKKIVLHPGSHVGQSFENGLENIIHNLRQILDNTKDTEVNILLETMAGKGNEIGFKFDHLAYIIEKLASERVNVCLDTCHIFDSGYDIVNHYEEVINDFDKIIGLDRLKVIHLNDSKNPVGSKKDRHENIGFGNIGFETLYKFCVDKRFENIPKILETPYIKKDGQEFAPYKYEIAMLRSGKFNSLLIDEIIK